MFWKARRNPLVWLQLRNFLDASRYYQLRLEGSFPSHLRWERNWEQNF